MNGQIQQLCSFTEVQRIVGILSLRLGIAPERNIMNERRGFPLFVTAFSRERVELLVPLGKGLAGSFGGV